MSTHVEELRWKIDEAIDEWLLAQGMTLEQIHKLDYSFLDNELNDLVDPEPIIGEDEGGFYTDSGYVKEV